MCRDVALAIIRDMLDELHKGRDIRMSARQFMEQCDYMELGIEPDEVQRDRLMEYIMLFNTTKMCEYDIFTSAEAFYEILETELKPPQWRKIKEFLDAGNILSDYKV